MVKQRPCFFICGALLIAATVISQYFYIYNNQVQNIKFKDKKIYDRIKYRIEGPLKANDVNLIKLIRQNYLVPPSSDEYKLSKSSVYKKQSKELSWGFIYNYTKTLFNNKPNGFFVEAGALDGEYLSNTLWLEKEKGWTGLLIEPDPTNFAALLTKNRKAWIANVGLSTVPYPEKSVFTIIDAYQKENQVHELYGLWAAKGQSFDSQKGFIDEDFSKYHTIYSSIQCFPLESLLLALNSSVVDFLSLDIQGREWDVLKLFPFDRIKVRAMVVEYYVDEMPGKYSQEFVDYFKGMGFAFVGNSFEPDYFFINSEEKDLLRNLSIIL